MQLFILFSSIAVLPTILTNPVPDTSDYSSFLPGETLAFEDGDSASPMIFDSAQSQGLDFPDSTFLPLQTESNSGSSDMSFETALFSDALDTPLETELFAGSSNSLLESSCTSEGDFQPFAKRDSQICAPKAAVEPSPFLNLPDLDDLERAVGSGDKKERYLPAFPIPLIEGYSENSEVCPKPRRRLCCLGPLSQYAISLNAWTVVSQCRDFGPWPCTARYDVCCRDFLNFVFPGNRLAASGISCVVLSENKNGIIWDGLPGTLP